VALSTDAEEKTWLHDLKEAMMGFKVGSFGFHVQSRESKKKALTTNLL